MSDSQRKIFDDMAQLASSAFATANDMKQAAEDAFKPHIERMVASMQLVTREEFEVVKEMAAKARKENAELRAEIAKLTGAKPKAKLANPAKKAGTARKPAVKKSAAKKPAASKKAVSKAPAKKAGTARKPKAS